MIGWCCLLPEGQWGNEHDNNLADYNTSGRIHSNLVNYICQLCKFGHGFANLIAQPT